MELKSRCIVLRCIKYGDSRTMVTLLSRAGGRLSLAVPMGGGRGSALRRALLMPGHVVDCVIDVRPGRDVHRLVECRGVPGFDVAVGGSRALLLWWICDVVDLLTRAGDADAVMYDYVESSLAMIAGNGSVAWGAVIFMVGLAELTGIMPDAATYRVGRVFDVRGGVFRHTPPLEGRWLDAYQARVARVVMDIRWDNARRYRWGREARAGVLDGVVEYFATHLDGMGQLRTLDILRSL